MLTNDAIGPLLHGSAPPPRWKHITWRFTLIWSLISSSYAAGVPAPYAWWTSIVYTEFHYIFEEFFWYLPLP